MPLYFRTEDPFNPVRRRKVLVDTAEWIKQCARVQEKKDRFVSRMDEFFRLPEDEIERIRRDAHELLCREVDSRIVPVSWIELSSGGGYHLPRSLVNVERV